jgi:PAS domain S-box-containing protein
VSPAYRDLLDRHPMYGLLAVPMRARGRVLGVVGVSRRAAGRDYTMEDLALLEAMADHAALAVDNASLYAEARAAENRYRALIAGTTDGVVISDASGRFLDANPAALDLVGYTLEELRALPPGPSRLTIESPERMAEAWDQLRRDGHWLGDWRVRHKSGRAVPIETSVAEVELPSGPAYIAIWRDATARRHLERLQQDFLAMTTHDLRSPLTALRVQIQLLRRRGQLDAESESPLLAQVDRINRLVEDLSEVARLEAGGVELRRSEFDLRDLARESVAAATPLAGHRRIALALRDRPVVGTWDRNRVGQVLQNLLGNALKYTPDGSEVTVAVETRDRVAALSVSDRGPGISPANLPRLFDRFYRIDPDGSATGLGLGLYIARMLVDAHGGRITVDSTPGEGSCFTVTLPLG